MKREKLLEIIEIKQKILKNLEEIFINKDVVFSYFNIKIEESKIENLLKEIQILENEIEILEYEDLKNQTSIHNQSISNFSESDQKKLIKLLVETKSGIRDCSHNEWYNLIIGERIILIYYFNGWEEVKAKILYENLEDIKSYKLAYYYFQYDYSSDPPFESRPPELVGAITGVFNYIFKIYENNL